MAATGTTVADTLGGAAQEVLRALVDTKLETDPKDQYRKYQCSYTATAYIRDLPVRNMRPITFEVGFRGGKVPNELPSRVQQFYDWLGTTHFLGDSSMPVSVDIRESLLSLKFRTATVPDWHDFNFNEVVRRLAALLAYCSFCPDADADMLLAGKPFDVAGFVNPDDPHSVCTNGVFVSRAMCPRDDYHVWYVTAAAASGCGVHVMTEFLRVDVTGGIELMKPTGGNLWNALVDALATLAALYESCGVGDVFAVALFMGIHHSVSVVGHSDEGGIMRDILRSGNFRAPFGGIPPMHTRHAGIPGLGGCSDRRRLANLVDSLALLSAAAVAHCDPLVAHPGGRPFPTIIECNLPPGTDRQRKNLEYLIRPFSAFAPAYVFALCRIIGLGTTSDRGLGVAILQSALNIRAATPVQPTRHADFPVLAPFYWIEPTGLLPRRWVGTAAEAECMASMGRDCEETVLPYFSEAVCEVGKGSWESEWLVRWRNARSEGFVWLANGYHGDGLACLVPTALGPQDVVLHSLPTGVSVETALAQGLNISDYLWTRGQSSAVHPAEFMHVGACIRFHITHAAMKTGRQITVAATVPDANEIDSTVVRISASRVIGIAPGKLGHENTELRRDRTRAMEALHEIGQIAYATGGRADVFHIVATAPPAWPGLPARTHRAGEGPADESKGGSASTTAWPDSAPGSTRGKTLTVMGVHGAHNFPPAPRGAQAAPSVTTRPGPQGLLGVKANPSATGTVVVGGGTQAQAATAPGAAGGGVGDKRQDAQAGAGPMGAGPCNLVVGHAQVGQALQPPTVQALASPKSSSDLFQSASSTAPAGTAQAAPLVGGAAAN